ncbi:tautomerase PptA [Streptomyces sp. 769]|uniref:tautomerase PptA n=1 Tax=Streptomyces sp. 769 TaxID=1262452 RepID=UPI00057D5966|nr:tautomerase PptA [Streptomyces sp. 769]AJC54251.1 tautomerase enzyme superfamily protein [Streptomyces sp. 769]
MPHVNIKHFPKDFTDEQKQQLAQAITEAVTEHFRTYDGAVSIALEPVAAHDWHETVYRPEITGRQHLLVKEPNYRND